MTYSRITAIETANPEMLLRQTAALEFVRKKAGLSKPTVKWYERFLLDRGIESRYFGLQNLGQIDSETPDEQNKRFQTVAVQMATRALVKALVSAGLAPEQLDGLIVTTCTGYLCPGLTSYIAESSGLRSDLFTLDIAGTGCGAALPALRSAHQFLKSSPESFVAVLCVEVCSAAIDWGDEIDLILSNSIFGDGAACAILTNHPARTGIAVNHFESIVWPQYREHLRFRTRNSRLSNVIHPQVPSIAAQAIRELMRKFKNAGWAEGSEAKRHWAVHPGGRKVLDEIEKTVPDMAGKLECSRAVLRQYGNMSSPSVLFVLKEMLHRQTLSIGDKVMMFAFGAGFTAFGAELELKPAIERNRKEMTHEFAI